MKRVFNLLVVDESGSMSVIQHQALAGINETLSTIHKMQKMHKNIEQRVTLITFDSTHKTTFQLHAFIHWVLRIIDQWGPHLFMTPSVWA